MNMRACGVALVLVAGIGSQYGNGESQARERQPFVARAPRAEQVDQAALVAQQWTDHQWEYSVQLLEPGLPDAQHRSRNPAGQLVLPARQTSLAPAF